MPPLEFRYHIVGPLNKYCYLAFGFGLALGSAFGKGFDLALGRLFGFGFGVQKEMMIKMLKIRKKVFCIDLARIMIHRVKK